MRITPKTVKIEDLVDGFQNNDEEGVWGYGGKLNIRPAYQREFVYDEKQQKAVIDSIFKGFPLNVMYWVLNDDGNYELLDGQQRTLSICSYYNGELFVDIGGTLKSFDNLLKSERDQFLNYEIQVYVCEDGTDKEKLDWFRIINIAGERLTDQELLNAVYTGPWITSAKKRFSKSDCVAYKLGSDYMNGSPIRQDYLETVLSWIAGGKNKIEEYMAQHQHDQNSNAEWQYFQKLVAWIKSLFPKKRREMKNVNWGPLYAAFKDTTLTSSELEQEVSRLMKDSDVTNKKGIYEYVLNGNENALSIRAFDDNMKREAYERQGGKCAKCGKFFPIEEMEADHITPWSQGGHTTVDNLQMLCRDCNRRKSDK